MVKDGVQKRQFEDNLKVMIVSLWIVKETDNYWSIIYFLNEIKLTIASRTIV